MRFGPLFPRGAIIAAAGERQHCLDFYGKPLRAWSSDFIFWSPALCQGRGVGAQGTAAQLLAVSIANNSNYRQAVKPHEQCPHQSWPISCCDGVCSVSLLQHCHSCSAQDDGGRTALQKLIKAITDNILIAIFIEESDTVCTVCLWGFSRASGASTRHSRRWNRSKFSTLNVWISFPVVFPQMKINHEYNIFLIYEYASTLGRFFLYYNGVVCRTDGQS